jgi:hypothetical protein
MQPVEDALPHRGRYAGHFHQLLLAGFLHRGNRAEVSEKRPATPRSDAVDVIELTRQLAAQLAVIRDGEAVRLVANRRDQQGHRGAGCEVDRIARARLEQPLIGPRRVITLATASTLRQPDESEVVLQSEVGERAERRRHLTRTAVDHQQVR